MEHVRLSRHRTAGQTGFSLIELMVTLAIVVIILSVSLPGIRSITRAITLTSQEQKLTSHLLLARSESIKNGSITVICASDDGALCASDPNNWSNGWILFTDTDGDFSMNPGTDLLLRSHTSDANATIEWSNSSAVAFGGSGTLVNDSYGHFLICGMEDNSTLAREIHVQLSGRVHNDDQADCP